MNGVECEDCGNRYNTKVFGDSSSVPFICPEDRDIMNDKKFRLMGYHERWKEISKILTKGKKLTSKEIANKLGLEHRGQVYDALQCLIKKNIVVRENLSYHDIVYSRR